LPSMGYEWSYSMCLRPHGHYLHLAPQLKMELYLLHVDSKELDSSVIRLQIGQLRNLGLITVMGRKFSSPHHSDQFWNPPSPLCSGCQRVFSCGVKQPECEVDSLLPFDAKNNKWGHSCTLA